MHPSLEILEEILSSTAPIKNHAEKIEVIRNEIFGELSEEEVGRYINRVKSKIQFEVKTAYFKSKDKHRAAIMATGTGKSRIPIMIMEDDIRNLKGQSYKVLLVVPTEKLRDDNWKEEFYKWDCAELYENMERLCYASLDKIEGETYDFVIFDEGHNLTENKAKFFKNNVVKNSLLLTATKPKDLSKRVLLYNLGFSVIYELPLNEAVQLGVVAPYRIHIINVHLDNRHKYVKGGTKQKPFFQTEVQAYTYLSRLCDTKKDKNTFLRRMRLIYNLKSKTAAIRYIMEEVIPKEMRTIVFCGSKLQAATLSDYCFFSKPSLDDWERKYPEKVENYRFLLEKWQGDKYYNAFKQEQINSLYCVDALNEGQNLNNVDCGVMGQLNSNDKNFIQRLGRVIRFRPNHVGNIFIVRSVGTVDEIWIKHSLANINVTVKEYDFARLQIGLDKIEFEEQ